MFDASFNELLALRPALKEKYDVFLAAVNNTDKIPAAILAQCRSKVRQVHGLEAHVESEQSSDAENVALSIAEKMPFQHHDLLDEEIEQASALFGDDGCVTLLTAIAFFDATSRLELTFNQGDA